MFTAAFVVQGLFRSDENRAVAETVSALEAGPIGWVQQVNFVALGLPILVVPDDAPLHQWAGLYQRLVLAVWFPCLITLALRLRQIARKPA